MSTNQQSFRQYANAVDNNRLLATYKAVLEAAELFIAQQDGRRRVRICDIGSHDGELIVEVVSKLHRLDGIAVELTAIEQSESAHSDLLANLRYRGVHASAVLGNASELFQRWSGSTTQSMFDIVLVSHSLYYMKDTEAKLLLERAALLTHGAGYVIVSLDSATSPAYANFPGLQPRADCEARDGRTFFAEDLAKLMHAVPFRSYTTAVRPRNITLSSSQIADIVSFLHRCYPHDVISVHSDIVAAIINGSRTPSDVLTNNECIVVYRSDALLDGCRRQPQRLLVTYSLFLLVIVSVFVGMILAGEYASAWHLLALSGGMLFLISYGIYLWTVYLERGRGDWTRWAISVTALVPSLLYVVIGIASYFHVKVCVRGVVYDVHAAEVPLKLLTLITLLALWTVSDTRSRSDRSALASEVRRDQVILYGADVPFLLGFLFLGLAYIVSCASYGPVRMRDSDLTSFFIGAIALKVLVQSVVFTSAFYFEQKVLSRHWRS
jgi:hypothetical protein